MRAHSLEALLVSKANSGNMFALGRAGLPSAERLLVFMTKPSTIPAKAGRNGVARAADDAPERLTEISPP
ncbi:hypothetical protein D3C84_1112080 [compost metagenome]